MTIRLLLIDDEPHVLSALRRLLRQHPPVPEGRSFVQMTAPKGEALEDRRRPVGHRSAGDLPATTGAG